VAQAQHKVRGESIGAFLTRRLKEVGLSKLFGVPGDFNLEFLELVESDPELQWIGCCNELNASYAADGYARICGLSALVTTYGVGELSALCGVAGAFAEHVPIIAITGAPPLSEMRRRGLLHHTAGDGDYDNTMECGRTFSVAFARITPQNAVTEIDRCLRACVLEKRPVYLQFPSDIAYVKLETPIDPLKIEFESDQGALDDFVEAAKCQIDASKTIAILADADVSRYNQEGAVIALAEKLGCSIAVLGTAKGIFDETHSAYAGVYSGAASPASLRNHIEGVECLIRLSVRFIDSTTAVFSEHIAPAKSIEINGWSARVDNDNFSGICMPHAIAALVTAIRARTPQRLAKTDRPRQVAATGQITQAWFWSRLASFVEQGDVLIAENGTSLAGVNGMALPARTTVLSQPLWAAIGYSLPAAFGSMIAAPDRRHILFIGDGSFQLTAQELSSMLRHGCKPIIFLINNDGYTIERMILGERSSYNDIQRWDYAALPGVFAAGVAFDSCRVTTVAELEGALTKAVRPERLHFIEVVMERMDAPEALKKLGPMYARQDYGTAFPIR
jgi:indolepyruvate decarboxylase